MTAEVIARAFHEVYEQLAPSFDYHTRDQSTVKWEDVPVNTRDLMVATCQLLLDMDVIVPGVGVDR